MCLDSSPTIGSINDTTGTLGQIQGRIYIDNPEPANNLLLKVSDLSGKEIEQFKIENSTEKITW